MDVEMNLPLVCASERSLPFTWDLGVELKSTWVQQYREGAFAMVRIVGGYDFVLMMWSDRRDKYHGTPLISELRLRCP